MENFFLTRRSCRQFKPENVSRELLEKIILTASKAPTCGNMQLYSLVVTEAKDMKQKLAGYHYNQPASVTAPVILTVCADFNRFTRWCEINKAEAGYNNLHSFLTAMTDAIIFCQQIVTIAEMEGLATCYLGTVTYNAEEISGLLKLPELVVPVASIALGWPDIPGEKTERLPLNGIVHYEEYKNYSDNDIIEIFRIHDENSQNEVFIKENNKENLAQVFAEVRYPKTLNLEISKKFYELLKDKGFLTE